MADNDQAGILAEFQEFLEQKRQSESAEKEAEDFEVEIWTPDGAGVRTRRSHAKPFLQKLGIDLDPEGDTGGDKDDNSAGKDNPKGSGQRKNPPTGSTSTVRKYFTKNPVTKL